MSSHRNMACRMSRIASRIEFRIPRGASSPARERIPVNAPEIRWRGSDIVRLRHG